MEQNVLVALIQSVARKNAQTTKDPKCTLRKFVLQRDLTRKLREVAQKTLEGEGPKKTAQREREHEQQYQRQQQSVIPAEERMEASLASRKLPKVLPRPKPAASSWQPIPIAPAPKIEEVAMPMATTTTMSKHVYTPASMHAQPPVTLVFVSTPQGVVAVPVLVTSEGKGIVISPDYFMAATHDRGVKHFVSQDNNLEYPAAKRGRFSAEVAA